MKKILISTICGMSFALAHSQINASYPISPVPFTSVKVNDAFWSPRLQASREVTIPLAFRKCEETGRYRNFELAAHPNPSNEFKGLLFDDTDVYKTIEGASYILQTYPDKKLGQYIDSVLTIVAAAQEKDGYLYTARTMNPDGDPRWMGKNRWDKEEAGSHELYNLGHMIEGAVAHYMATGKRNFLNMAIKFADCADRELGYGANKRLIAPGHQIVEMALVRLYLVTGEKRYLRLAKFFLDVRGHDNGTRDNLHKSPEYDQTHLPVTKQYEAVGHAVRGTYMYSGMADVAALTGDTAYIYAIDKIWENIVSKKLYITGGIGGQRYGEAFGSDYQLPNLDAYCETCAAIGNVYLNHRLFLLHGESKYYDVLERTLYNGLISGVSLSGDAFFYPNPLEADGEYAFNADHTKERQPWFGCACCPSNICRFIPSLPGYIYAVKGDDLYVNLFIGNHADLTVNGKKVTVAQSTHYPTNGKIKVVVKPRGQQQFTLKLRLPGWLNSEVVPSQLYTFVDTISSPAYSVSLNGKLIDASVDKGYITIKRNWKSGDEIELSLDMRPRFIYANENVVDDRGCLAVQRGPLVYCAEEVDNDFDIRSVLVNRQGEIKETIMPNLLNGIVELNVASQALFYDKSKKLQAMDVNLKLIPYYAWNHRGVGKMLVWLPENANNVKPQQGVE